MLRAIGSVLFLALLGGAIGWLFYWNGHDATLYLSADQKIEFPMAGYILAALTTGALTILAVLSVRSLLATLRQMRQNRHLRRQVAADQMIQEGTQKLWSGDLKGAKKILGRAIRQRPHDLEAVLALARSHEEQEEWTAALETLETARAGRQGNEIRLLSRIGRLALARGKPSAAVDAFRGAVQQRPDSPRLWSELADALTAEGNFREATKAAESCLSHEKTPHRQAQTRQLWFSLRYRAALAEADPTIAVEELRRLTKEAPDFLPPVLEWARLLRETGDSKGADRLYRSALKRETRGVLFERLISLHARSGTPEKALPLLRSVSQDNPAVAPRLALIRVLLSCKETAAAATEITELSRKAMLDPLLDIAPERDLLAGHLAAARGDDREAATLFRRAAEGSRRAFAYICRDCRRPADEWSDACPCGTWGEYEWVVGTIRLRPESD